MRFALGHFIGCRAVFHTDYSSEGFERLKVSSFWEEERLEFAAGKNLRIAFIGCDVADSLNEYVLESFTPLLWLPSASRQIRGQAPTATASLWAVELVTSQGCT